MKLYRSNPNAIPYPTLRCPPASPIRLRSHPSTRRPFCPRADFAEPSKADSAGGLQHSSRLHILHTKQLHHRKAAFEIGEVSQSGERLPRSPPSTHKLCFPGEQRALIIEMRLPKSGHDHHSRLGSPRAQDMGWKSRLRLLGSPSQASFRTEAGLERDVPCR
jgi:hypothetical protein